MNGIDVKYMDDFYYPNSHYFGIAGPSIVASCLSTNFASQKEKNDSRIKEEKLINTHNKNDTKISSDFISSNNGGQNSSNSLETSKDIHYESNKSILQIQMDFNLNIPTIQNDDTFEKSRFIPTNQFLSNTKERNLSPETLCEQLNAELDHFLKIEQELGNFAEINSNVEIAQHESYVAKNITFDDDKEELAELQQLDKEIAQLQSIYAKKLITKGYSIQ